MCISLRLDANADTFVEFAPIIIIKLYVVLKCLGLYRDICFLNSDIEVYFNSILLRFEKF